MSDIANQVHLILNKIFPANPHRRVFPEFFVNYRGTRLFFDFYVKEMSLFIEVQGLQHSGFVKHFHGSKEGFVAQKHRDNLKVEYAQENDCFLVRFNYDEEITEKLVRHKIGEVLENKNGFYE